MNPKTPEQIEDDAIKDAIRSVVGLKARMMQRELQNQVIERVAPKITTARLQGRKIDVDKFVSEVLREVAAG